MAKPEHVDKLKEGAEVWNTWWYKNLGIVPAFWGAGLEETDLRGADLKKADFEGANLMNARYLLAGQLSEVKTLYQAELDPELEEEVRKARPHLFDKPRENTN